MSTDLPKHIAIIMDGNGRWATHRNHLRSFGHIQGSHLAREVVEESTRIGIENLTLFVLSTENTLRPKIEIQSLVNLLKNNLIKNESLLLENNIKLCCIGDLSYFEEIIQETLNKLIEKTKYATGMTLTLALNYGGQQEIVKTARRLAENIKAGKLQTEEINLKVFSDHMESSFLPDPDLIIRTGGGQRLSNFLLWQTAYSELYFTNTLWPDFNKEELHLAIDHFKIAQRKFGLVPKQVNSKQDELPL